MKIKLLPHCFKSSSENNMNSEYKYVLTVNLKLGKIRNFTTLSMGLLMNPIDLLIFGHQYCSVIHRK